MAESNSADLMDKIVSLCKRRGFIFQSSEIYGGINGFWDYGPLGADLKRNVKDFWWTTLTRMREDVVGLEATIIMHPQIWKASGHVATFADMMRECPLTRKRIRADQVEPQSGNVVRYSGVYRRAEDRGRFFSLVSEFAPSITTDEDLKKLLLDNITEAETAKINGQIQVAPISTNAQKAGFQELAVRELLEDSVFRNFSILLQPGKPLESAQKAAAQFYTESGYKDFVLLGERREKVEKSVDFHPESGVELSEARPFNLMLKTTVGPLDIPPLDFDPVTNLQKWLVWKSTFEESQKNVAYLRPETAQAIFAQFKNVLESSRQKLPFGIAQMGKAFRNEVTPRNFTFRSREFEQMELEFFIKPDEAIEAISGNVAKPSGPSHPGEPQANWGWQIWHQYWVEERIRFYESIGLPRTTLEEYWQKPEELAHYAKATVDLLFKFPFGTQELEGIAARSDYDLSQHQRFSGKPMTVFDDELKAAWTKLDAAKQSALKESYHQARLKYLTKAEVPAEKAEKTAREEAEAFTKGYYVPHVIEPSAGVDRLALALISNAYNEDQAPDEKGKMETRVVLKLHPRIAPIKVAVFPLLKNKPELVKKAQEVRDLLRPYMTVFYDEASAIGRRYRRQDEVGTPFGVTIDFDTLGEKGPELADTVTLRERDTMKQERVKISDLLGILLPRVR